MLENALMLVVAAGLLVAALHADIGRDARQAFLSAHDRLSSLQHALRGG